jgi:hypothetical protein
VPETFTTIHIHLLDEGVEVWRPVKAVHVRGDIYRILDTPTAYEKWEFPTGDVRCKWRRLSGDGGNLGDCLVAFERPT